MNDGEHLTVGADVKVEDTKEVVVPEPVVEAPVVAPVSRPPFTPKPPRMGWIRLKRVPDAERITAVTVNRGERSRVIGIPNFDAVEVPLDVAQAALKTGSFVEADKNFAKVKK